MKTCARAEHVFGAVRQAVRGDVPDIALRAQAAPGDAVTLRPHLQLPHAPGRELRAHMGTNRPLYGAGRRGRIPTPMRGNTHM